MTVFWKEVVWQQFGAAIDMLDDAVRACPDELWETRLWDHPTERSAYSEFWFLAFHTLFWTDLYLSGSREGFAIPTYLKREVDEEGVPLAPYSKEDIQSYLQHCRDKSQTTIEALTEETAQRLCRFGWGEVTFLELILYTMRHVQEHAAHLSLLLGQRVGATSAPDWVARARTGTANIA
jgi:hypothetical protein